MLYKKFRLCAQVVGCITIGLLAVYGLVAVLGGGDLVAWASGRAAPAAGNVSSVMNYQGHLKDDSGVPLDGTYDITFRIYDSVVAPAALWEETHADVTVREGYFNVLLGSGVPLPDDLFSVPDRYIGVTVAPYDEMTPRQRFASVPYAFYAGQAERAFGLSAADGDPADAVVVDNWGNVGVGTTWPRSMLHVNGDYYGEGDVHLYAAEGEGASGTAYLEAYDSTDSSNIDILFRTKEGAVGHDVMKLTSAGNVEVSNYLGVIGGLGVNGNYYGRGNVHLYAVEGEGASGTAYFKAYDTSGDSSIGLQFQTSQAGVVTDVMRLTPDGNVEVSGNAQVSGDLNVSGDIINFSVTDYSVRGLGSQPISPYAKSICFLSGINTNAGSCMIRHWDGNWQLQNISISSDFTCEATCLSW